MLKQIKVKDKKEMIRVIERFHLVLNRCPGCVLGRSRYGAAKILQIKDNYFIVNITACTATACTMV